MRRRPPPPPPPTSGTGWTTHPPLPLCRIGRCSLVSRRWYAICHSSQLVHDVRMAPCYPEERLLPKLRSLQLWMLRHAGHVECLHLGLNRLPDVPTEAHALVAGVLVACSAAGRLRHLSLYALGWPLAVSSWAARLSSLEALNITARRIEVTASLAGLKSLKQLQLDGHEVVMLPSVSCTCSVLATQPLAVLAAWVVDAVALQVTACSVRLMAQLKLHCHDAAGGAATGPDARLSGCPRPAATGKPALCQPGSGRSSNCLRLPTMPMHVSATPEITTLGFALPKPNQIVALAALESLELSGCAQGAGASLSALTNLAGSLLCLTVVDCARLPPGLSGLTGLQDLDVSLGLPAPHAAADVGPAIANLTQLTNL